MNGILIFSSAMGFCNTKRKTLINDCLRPFVSWYNMLLLLFKEHPSHSALCCHISDELSPFAVKSMFWLRSGPITLQEITYPDLVVARTVLSFLVLVRLQRRRIFSGQPRFRPCYDLVIKDGPWRENPRDCRQVSPPPFLSLQGLIK